MNICAIDIETLGTSSDSVVLSIGVVTSSGREFSSSLSVTDQMRKGRLINPSTVQWWATQSDEAWEASTISPTHPGAVLLALTSFLAREKVDEIWARGSMDQHTLESLFRSFNLPAPWKYSVWRDERTLDLLGVELAVERLERKHLSHSALGDARNCLANVLHLKGELVALKAEAVDLRNIAGVK